MKKFTVNPVAFCVWIWLFVVFGWIYALNCVLAIILHELGHYVVAKMLGYQLSKFSLSPYGVSLSYYDVDLDENDEFWIAVAGPAVNIVSIVFVLGVWWIFPSTYFLFQSYVEISLVIALFNLLPAYPLDGGRIFVCFFRKIFDEQKAHKITIICNLFLSFFFLICFLICLFIQFNPTLLLFSIFMFGGMLDLKQKSQYEKINIFCKKTKNFVKPTFYCVGFETTLSDLLSKMQSSKTCIFCITLKSGKVLNLSEFFVQKLLTKYNIKTKLSEIIKNTNS